MCKFLCKCNRLPHTESPFQCHIDQVCLALESNKMTDVKSSKAISNLALKVDKSLECVLTNNVFLLEPHENVEDLCGTVRAQWKLDHVNRTKM